MAIPALTLQKLQLPPGLAIVPELASLQEEAPQLNVPHEATVPDVATIPEVATVPEEAPQLNFLHERCFLKASGWRSVSYKTWHPSQKWQPSQKNPRMLNLPHERCFLKASGCRSVSYTKVAPVPELSIRCRRSIRLLKCQSVPRRS